MVSPFTFPSCTRNGIYKLASSCDETAVLSEGKKQVRSTIYRLLKRKTSAELLDSKTGREGHRKNKTILSLLNILSVRVVICVSVNSYACLSVCLKLKGFPFFTLVL